MKSPFLSILTRLSLIFSHFKAPCDQLSLRIAVQCLTTYFADSPTLAIYKQ